jgi:REP element-mobilizing transposase RayT
VNADTFNSLATRKMHRLAGFDYRNRLAYFVTICVAGRKHVFGSVENNAVRLSRRGLIAAAEWQALPTHFPHIELDAFVVMPNHLHAILCFVDDPVGATLASPAPSIPRGPQPGSLGAVIGGFKSGVTRRVNQLRPGVGTGMWPRDYYDHIIRNDRAHESIREYIAANPTNWAYDENNALATNVRSFESWMASKCREWAGDASVAPTSERPETT